MAVPYTFGAATAAIPLSQLDSNFASTITLGSTAIQLGNTVTILNNMTFANVTISSGSVTITDVTASGNVTISGGTANGVAYLNSSKILTTGSALVFDGSNLGVGVNPSAWGSGLKAIELGGSNSYLALNNTSASGYVYWNMWNDGTNNKTKQTGFIGAYGLNTSGGHVWFNGTGTTGITSSLTQAMTLDASGNLLVGATSPQGALTVQGSTSGAWASFCINTSSGGVGSYTRGGGGSASLPLAVWAQYDGTERARIDSSGNFLVGTTSGSSRFKVVADGTNVNSEFYQPASTSYTSIIFTNPSGTAGSITTTALTTTYATASDYRLKENIAPMTGALARVAALKPVTYKWKTDGSDGEGFIAHELQAVVPECVVGGKDAVDEEGNPKYQGIDTSFLVATLTAAIQELKAEFDAYKAEHP